MYPVLQFGVLVQDFFGYFTGHDTMYGRNTLRRKLVTSRVKHQKSKRACGSIKHQERMTPSDLTYVPLDSK